MYCAGRGTLLAREMAAAPDFGSLNQLGIARASLCNLADHDGLDIRRYLVLLSFLIGGHNAKNIRFDAPGEPTCSPSGDSNLGVDATGRVCWLEFARWRGTTG